MPSPLRAALYARYSTDLQRVTSIEDQLRLARARAQRDGWQIVAELSDEATSGSTPVAFRPAGKRLMEMAINRDIEVLVLESLDRLSRDSLEQEKAMRGLEHRGVRVIGLSDGYDSQAKGKTLLRGMRGLINSIFLEDLAYKTHRGLAGQFERGFSAGGRCYGYRSRPAPDGRGNLLVVDEEQAGIVQRIFAAYADGDSARSIAHRLNADGITSPRGGTWAVSALVGERKRGAGLLNNELYAGRLVWNRRQWLKDPETGCRRYVDRPASEWQIRDAPELRIVPPELWAAVRARDERREKRPNGGAPARTLFAGLLRCRSCGGPVVALDARRYGCNVHRDRGESACADGLAYPRRDVDAALLTVVRGELLAPAALAELHKAARSAMATARKGGSADASSARLAGLQAEIGRLVDAVAQVGISDALRARLAAAEAERARLETQARQAPAPALSADQVVAAYKRRMLQLQAALESDGDRARTRELLADMLGPVVLTRDDDGVWAEMQEPAQRVALAGSLSTMVAGARNMGCRRVRVR